MKRINNVSPGEILLEEFLKPMKISAYKLSHSILKPQGRISGIIHNKRRITADTALRLSKFFGTTAQFWMGLQDDFDLEEEKIKIEKELNSIKKFELLVV